MAFTLNDILTEVSLDYDASNVPPASSTVEYQRRVRLCNRFERQWAQELDYKWSQLLKNTTLTIAANTNTVAMPSDFRAGNIALDSSGCLKIGTQYYTFVNEPQVQDYDGSTMLAFVTGNDAEGYELNIQPTPSDEKTVYLKYYSTHLATDTTGTTGKTVLVNATDVTKCSNPYYMVYMMLSVLYKADDDEIGRAQDYERLGFECMSSMIGQRILGNENQDNEIGVYPDISGFSGIGE